MPDMDVAVIGAGAAGLSVAAVAAQLGLKVALIEAGRMGGDCLNTGCVPSKALLASAHAAMAARGAGQIGIHLAPPRIDWDDVQAHVHGAIARLAPMDSEERFRGLGATVLRGHARFAGRDALAVTMADGTEQRLSARRIVIAAGASPSIPAIPGLDQVPFLTNLTLFDLPACPRHLLILGGGPIGVEMAQAHAALGAKVTVISRGRILAHEDAELAGGLAWVLRAQGITLREDCTISAIEPGPVIVLHDGERIAGSDLLIATGRQPNLAPLDLPQGGVKASAAGVRTDSGLRSVSNRRVYAVGDIADPAGIGPRYFTHVGSYHAGIVIRRMLFRLPARVDYAALPRVTYTDPELAQVGLTEADAAGQSIRVLRWSMAENDRAVAENQTAGSVKLVVSRQGRVLGAGILAPHAGEMISQWTLAIAKRVKLSTLAGLIVPYPTRAEAAKRATGSFYAASLFAPRTRRIIRLLSRLP